MLPLNSDIISLMMESDDEYDDFDNDDEDYFGGIMEYGRWFKYDKRASSISNH